MVEGSAYLSGVIQVLLLDGFVPTSGGVSEALLAAAMLRLGMDLQLPERYLPEPPLRLSFYKRLAACDDEGVKGVSTADLTISPARFTFSRVAIGQDEDRSITIRNTGQGTLVINRIEGSFGSNEEFTLYYQGHPPETPVEILEQTLTPVTFTADGVPPGGVPPRPDIGAPGGLALDAGAAPDPAVVPVGMSGASN